MIPFDIFEAAHVKGSQSIAIMVVRFNMSQSHTATQRRPEPGTLLNIVCREMQHCFHSALESLFVSHAALLIREVVYASMEPSAEMIGPIVRLGTRHNEYNDYQRARSPANSFSSILNILV